MTIFKPTTMTEDADGVTLGYMDLTDFECELGMASGGNSVYNSPEEVLTYRKCAHQCGVVEIEIRFRRIMVEPKEDYI